MMLKKMMLVFTTAAVLLSSCGGSDTKKDNAVTDAKKEENRGGKELISNAKAPAGFTFERKDFEGIGTIELPTGSDWEKEDNELINEKLNMVIVVQSHASEDMSAIIDDYLESYEDVNKRDAPNWKRSSKQVGTINGLPGARVEGSFDNGTTYAVRDYLFFEKNKTAILQCRIAQTNKDKLNAVIDYIGASFKK